MAKRADMIFICYSTEISNPLDQIIRCYAELQVCGKPIGLLRVSLSTKQQNMISQIDDVEQIWHFAVKKKLTIVDLLPNEAKD